MSFVLVPLRSSPASNSSAINLAPKEKPSLLTILLLQRQLFEALSDFQRKDIVVTQKITLIKQLHVSADLLRTSCEELQTDCEKSVDALPFYCFFTKWRLWLAKHDLFIFGTDETSQTYSAARTTIVELKKRIQHLVQKELLNLSDQTAKSCEESFGIVGLYDALHLIEPENSRPIECMAKWLIQEKAFGEAAKILKELIKRHPQNRALHFQLVDALLGSKHYQEAEEKISEIKLRLTSPEKEETSENALQTQKDLDKIDELKAECFALQKRYKDALNILNELTKRQPQNDGIKHNIILYMRHQELEDHGDRDLTELDKKFYFASPKQIFATLHTFKETASSHDNLISDLEFWLDTLTAHPKLFKNIKINKFIQEQIADLINSGHISKELLLKKVGERLNKLQESQKFIEERFYSLMQNINQLKDQDPRQIAILKARTIELEHTFYGDSSLHGSIGLLGKRELSQSILDELSKNTSYHDTESVRCLSLLIGRLGSGEVSIVSCGKQFRTLTQPASMQRLLRD